MRPICGRYAELCDLEKFCVLAGRFAQIPSFFYEDFAKFIFFSAHFAQIPSFFYEDFVKIIRKQLEKAMIKLKVVVFLIRNHCNKTLHRCV